MTQQNFDAPLAQAWLAAAAEAIERHRDELTALDSAIGDGDHGANLSRGFAAVTVALAEQAEKAAQAAEAARVEEAERAARAAGSGADGSGDGDGEGGGGDGDGDSDSDSDSERDGDGDGDGEEGLTAGQVFTLAGNTLISKVGGASGPLYGSALRAIGKSIDAAREDRLSGKAPNCQGPNGANILAALRVGLDAVVKLGHAEVGDKTMVDAYAPAVDAFGDALGAGAGLPAATLAAAEAAERGAADTVPLVARKGRASYLGERSAGHQDPGATSTALLFRALADVLGAAATAARRR